MIRDNESFTMSGKVRTDAKKGDVTCLTESKKKSRTMRCFHLEKTINCDLCCH